MLHLLLLIVGILIVWALVKGLLKWVIIAALSTFTFFFLSQPTHVSAATKAQIAMHQVLKKGQSLSMTVAHSPIVITNWQRILYTVQHWI
ncbi:MAG: hypothetical protein OWS74_07420 [Firmicutes bacterium]|nr:hypothetical protein [Bacillota bacterium]